MTTKTLLCPTEIFLTAPVDCPLPCSAIFILCFPSSDAKAEQDCRTSFWLWETLFQALYLPQISCAFSRKSHKVSPTTGSQSLASGSRFHVPHETQGVWWQRAGTSHTNEQICLWISAALHSLSPHSPEFHRPSSWPRRYIFLGRSWQFAFLNNSAGHWAGSEMRLRRFKPSVSSL